MREIEELQAFFRQPIPSIHDIEPIKEPDAKKEEESK